MMTETVDTQTGWGKDLAPTAKNHLLDAEKGDQIKVNDRVNPMDVMKVIERPEDGFDGRTELHLQANGCDYVITVDHWNPEARFYTLNSGRGAGNELEAIDCVVPDHIVNPEPEGEDDDSEEKDAGELDATTVLSEREEREAAYRHVFMGQSCRDVGEILGVSGSTVSTVIQAYKSGGADLERSILDQFADRDTPKEDRDGREFLTVDGGARKDERDESGERVACDGGVSPDSDELETPIKVRWTGTARAKLTDWAMDGIGVKPEEFTDAVGRQKTNVVIKTVAEAEAVAGFLNKCIGEHRGGRVWVNKAVSDACERVQSEVIAAMNERGYVVEGDKSDFALEFVRREPTTDGGEGGYVAPDQYEKNRERIDHAEQRNRQRTISGGGRFMTDGGETPRDVLTDLIGGEALSVTLADGSEFAGHVSDVERSDAELPGERDHVTVHFTADPGIEHVMTVYLDRDQSVTLTRPMFADAAAEQGHIPASEVDDPDERVDVDLGEVVSVERRLETDGGSPDSPVVELSDLTDSVSEGDTLVVDYETSYGNQNTKSGEVTHISLESVVCDTGDEREDGEPVLFRVWVSGRVESVTPDNDKRISSGYADHQKTQVKILSGGLETDGGEPTIPVDAAMDASEFQIQTTDGEDWTLVVVGSDIDDDDAYVNGRYGGRAREYTCEADGPDGLTHVFHVWAEAERGADRATLDVWERVGPEDDQRLELADVSVRREDGGELVTDGGEETVTIVAFDTCHVTYKVPKSDVDGDTVSMENATKKDVEVHHDPYQLKRKDTGEEVSERE